MKVETDNKTLIFLNLMIKYTLSKIKTITTSKICQSTIIKVLMVLAMYHTDKALQILERFSNLMN